MIKSLEPSETVPYTGVVAELPEGKGEEGASPLSSAIPSRSSSFSSQKLVQLQEAPEE